MSDRGRVDINMKIPLNFLSGIFFAVLSVIIIVISYLSSLNGNKKNWTDSLDE